jgi:hypothetical protein
VGGFNGTDSASTLEQFKRYGAEKRIHYFIGAGMRGSDDAARIAEWVRETFTAHDRACPRLLDEKSHNCPVTSCGIPFPLARTRLR